MEELGQVYARALFESAMEHGVLDDDPRAARRFGPTRWARTRTCRRSSSRRASHGREEGRDPPDHRRRRRALPNFLELLAERHRLPVTFRIRRAFDELWREEHKLLPVEVTSAIELDDALVSSIGERIEERTGRRVELTAGSTRTSSAAWCCAWATRCSTPACRAASNDFADR